MKDLTSLIMAASALLSAQSVNATTYAPTGVHTFSGPVDFQKNSGVYNCTMKIDIDASSSSTTAVLSSAGAYSCFAVVSGQGVLTFDGTHLTLSGLTLQFYPNSPCTGSIKMLWGGNGIMPRTIQMSTPLSNSTAPSGRPCKFMGTLSQTSGPGALTITNP